MLLDLSDFVAYYHINSYLFILYSARSCGDPGTPNHGLINGTSFEYGDEVTFSCSTGYQLLGHSTLKCMASGKWYGTTPQCIGN